MIGNYKEIVHPLSFCTPIKCFKQGLIMIHFLFTNYFFADRLSCYFIHIEGR